jgi:hypothetical protein
MHAEVMMIAGIDQEIRPRDALTHTGRPTIKETTSPRVTLATPGMRVHAARVQRHHHLPFSMKTTRTLSSATTLKTGALDLVLTREIGHLQTRSKSMD